MQMYFGSDKIVSRAEQNYSDQKKIVTRYFSNNAFGESKPPYNERVPLPVLQMSGMQ